MNYKWTLFTFSRGDFKAVERYLNEQAEQGWELDRVGILARWKRTERTDLTYCVDLAKPKQEHDERLDYAEFCRDGGWELTSFTGGMYIFKSLPGAQLIPVQTDPELAKKNYNKYYVRNTILSAAFLVLYLGFWIFMSAALGRYTEDAVTALYYELMIRWVMVGLIPALPIWAVWAVWKIADFIRTTIQSRTGEIGQSPRWVMWVNCVLSFLAGVGGVLFLLGDVLEILLIADMNSYVLILTILWGIVCFYRALAMDRELFKGERRRYIAVGATLVLIFGMLIIGRTLLPYGQWYTYRNEEKALAAYEQTFDQPLVHGEDIGIPFEMETGENVLVLHEVTAMGEHRELQYLYRGDKSFGGSLGLGSQTTECFTEKQAKLLTAALASGIRRQRHAPWPENGLRKTDLSWADETWYEILSRDGGEITVLVLRVGKQVTKLTFPGNLMNEETLSVIQAELTK